MSVITRNLESLKFARSVGLPWDEYTFKLAISTYNMKMIVWMKIGVVEEGGEACPWNDECCLQAVVINNLETLQWLVQNGCPYNKVKLLEIADISNNDIVEYITSLP